jgi:hypothetical protein
MSPHSISNSTDAISSLVDLQYYFTTKINTSGFEFPPALFYCDRCDVSNLQQYLSYPAVVSLFFSSRRPIRSIVDRPERIGHDDDDDRTRRLQQLRRLVMDKYNCRVVGNQVIRSIIKRNVEEC